MRWHDYPTLLKSFAKAKGIEELDIQEIYLDIASGMAHSKYPGTGNTLGQLRSEMNWILEDRPYYNLYPTVAEAFTKVSLNKIKCSDIHLPLPQLMIRMPIDQELQISPEMKMRNLFIAEIPQSGIQERALIVAINDNSTMPVGDNRSIVIHTLNSLTLLPDSTIAERLDAGRAKPYSEDKIDNEAVDNALRLVCTLCLLKDNPDLIEAIPLDKDRERWEKTHDPLLIQKAFKRGKRGWDIGRKIEVAPGFRRPHFAIRWCGKGRTDPQVRPIKGCLVNRKAIEEVPTDWLGPENT